MSLALLFHYLMLNMFRMLIHPSSGTCDLSVELFHGLYCSGSVCVGVTLWFGWGGVVSVCRLKYYLMLNMFRMLIHPTSGDCDYLLSYFMGFIVLVRCVLVLRCGLAGVVWYPYANSMSLALSFHYLMLNMFRMLIHPTSGACD